MANFLKDFEAEFDEDTVIQGVRFNSLINHWGFNDREDPRDEKVRPFVGKILTWEEAKPLLDYKFDPGYGSMDCHEVTVWTENKVFYIHEYDGSTSIQFVDRNPIERE